MRVSMPYILQRKKEYCVVHAIYELDNMREQKG